MKDLTFNGMRGDVRQAIDDLQKLNDKGEETDIEAMDAVLTIVEVIGLTFIQIAQDLNEIKHSLTNSKD